MAVSAEIAARAWINSRHDLVGDGRPLARGAYLNGQQPRSPAHGAYALLIREPGTNQEMTAEPGGPSVARITAHVYAGTIGAAEAAAVAVANAWRTPSGTTERCGDTGVMVMAAGNFAEPGYVPMPGSGGEQHLFTTGADLVLYQPEP
jgi:hypothetical protein